MDPLVILSIILLVGGGSLLRWFVYRSRPSDIRAIDEWARESKLRIVSVDRYPWQWWQSGNFSLSFFSRIYLVIIDGSVANRREFHIAFDPFGVGKRQVLQDHRHFAVDESKTAGRLRLLRNAAVVLFVGVFVYGFVVHSDAPIRPCGDAQYCGKREQPHSKAEYDAFKLWEIVLLASGTTVALSSVFQLLSRRRSSRSSTIGPMKGSE